MGSIPAEMLRGQQQRVLGAAPTVESEERTPQPMNPPQQTKAAPAMTLASRRGISKLKMPLLPLTTQQGGIAEDRPYVPTRSLGDLSDFAIMVADLPRKKSVTLGDISTCTTSTQDPEPISPSLASEVSTDSDEWELQVREELGSGSMGFVKKVVRTCDGQVLAGKTVGFGETERLRALREEFELLRSLDHGSIVRAEAFIPEPSGTWLCMELCGGGSVDDYVKRNGAFDEPRALELSLQLLEGIDYLHSKRVVHRDIKPANLLLTEDAAQLRIGDFGSARRVGSDSLDGPMLSDRGTKLYNAPELRFCLQWNERVDVWACGLCIFIMLRAEMPYDGGKRSTLRRLQEGCLPNIDWGDMGCESRSLVLQCLAVEMRDRPVAMELLLHPAFEGLRPADAGAATSSGSTQLSLPACGLLTESAGAAEPGIPAHCSPFEQALRQLTQRKFLKVQESDQTGAAAAHKCPF